MTVCYIGTPITPKDVLLTLAGRAFCLCYYNRRTFSLPLMTSISSQTLYDWGGFNAWQAGIDLNEDYRKAYYEWLDPLLDDPQSWAVIPDEIGASTQILDPLIREWPHGDKGAPVYHLDAQMMQSPERLLRLLDEYPRVCIGWAEKSLPIMGDDHRRCLDLIWNEVSKRHRRTPYLHHFRGTQMVMGPYPFASYDSTDIARNHHRPQNTAERMADRWDAAQSPPRWTRRKCLERELF